MTLTPIAPTSWALAIGSSPTSAGWTHLIGCRVWEAGLDCAACNVIDAAIMTLGKPAAGRSSKCALCGEFGAYHATWEDGSRTCPDAVLHGPS